MEYTHLGRTGLKVSRLCLGTMNFGSLTSEDESRAIMNQSLELGINFVDTADDLALNNSKSTTTRMAEPERRPTACGMEDARGRPRRRRRRSSGGRRRGTPATCTCCDLSFPNTPYALPSVDCDGVCRAACCRE